MRHTAFFFVLFSVSGNAGGMSLVTRGVAPTSMAGAVVAGTDDAHALWFNAAGLGSVEKRSLLVDVSWVHQGLSYSRIDSGLNPQPKVSSGAPGAAIPTIAFVAPMSKKWIVGGGVFAPYSVGGRFAVDGPQRYSLVRSDQQAIANMTVGLGYRVSEKLQLGFTVGNTLSSIKTEVVLGGCPEIVCAPEDPEFDSHSRLSQFDWFAPFASVGLQYQLNEHIRLGASILSPTRVGGRGKVEAKLPTSVLFDGASVRGDRASIRFWLPPIARVGAQFQKGNFALELAATAEFWGMHKEIEIADIDVVIEDIAGIGDYAIDDLAIERNFRTSVAAQLGVDYTMSDTLQLRGGYALETSAVPQSHISVVTVDSLKHLFAVGGKYTRSDWSFQWSVAGVFHPDVYVSPEEGRLRQQTPLRETEGAIINYGNYSAWWVTAGVGMQRNF